MYPAKNSGNDFYLGFKRRRKSTLLQTSANGLVDMAAGSFLPGLPTTMPIPKFALVFWKSSKALANGTTWKALSERYSTQQLMDVVFAVGQYTLVSMALNSFGVQLDPGVEGFPR